LWLNWGFDLLDQGEEAVDVDWFGDEGEIADREGALAILLAGIPRDGDSWNVSKTGQDS
jgi:hypothetical protein